MLAGMRRLRHTRIVATLGPASDTVETITALAQVGADTFRLNASHSDHDQLTQLVQRIRQVEQEQQQAIGIILDLQGPKLRLGHFTSGQVIIKQGQDFRFDLSAVPGDSQRVQVPHPEIFAVLKPGQHILVDDGKMRFVVEEAAQDYARCRALYAGVLADHKGVNVPDVVLPIAALTAKDRQDLQHGLALGVDWVALSFVQTLEDVQQLRPLLQNKAGLMVKIEKPSAMLHLHDIVTASDAVIVARGDLGVEMPLPEMPSLQKRIVRACRQIGRPVIIATQMLESMITAPSPTRAEVSDVANAVYDGADGVMLSAESAAGQYPVEAVRMMEQVLQSVEHDGAYDQMLHALSTEAVSDPEAAISAAAALLAVHTEAAAIVCYTLSGATALRVAQHRPLTPLLALTPSLATARRLSLAWGIEARVVETVQDLEVMVATARDLVRPYADTGEVLVITAGVPFGTVGATNMIRVVRV